MWDDEDVYTAVASIDIIWKRKKKGSVNVVRTHGIERLSKSLKIDLLSECTIDY